MTAREQLLREVEQAPDALVRTVLDFFLFVKQRQQLQAKPSQTVQPESNGVLDLLKDIEVMQSQVPEAEWDKVPHDGSINHDHYLYGAPKVDE
jgi:hypothetical protein